MSDSLQDQAVEQLLDWSLGELEGGSVAPDVTAKVAQRLLLHRTANRKVPPSSWLLRAAIMLLAAGSLFGVHLLSHQQIEPDRQSGRQPPQHETHIVNSAEEVASVPKDARSVTVLRHGDDVVELLVNRCPQLEALTVNTLENRSGSPTDRIFELIAKLPHLRELMLIKAVDVTGDGFPHLRDLPQLETFAFALGGLEPAAFAVLPLLPSLRVLDLSYTRGVDDEALRRIANCPGLRQLGIPGCKEVTAAGLAQIASLTRLETLELRQLTCSLDALRIDQLQRLTVLDAASTQFTNVFVDHLPASLTQLALSNTKADDTSCATLQQRLPKLHKLRIANTAITDAGIASLAKLPELHELDISNCLGLSKLCLAHLQMCEQLCTLTISDLAEITPEDIEPLMALGIAVKTDDRNQIARDIAKLMTRHAAAIASRRGRFAGK